MVKRFSYLIVLAGLSLPLLFSCQAKTTSQKNAEVGGVKAEEYPSDPRRSHPSLSIPDLSTYKIAYYPLVSQETAETQSPAIKESDDPFILADFGPKGELPDDVRKPSIFVVFSQPVVPLARLGAPVRDTKYLKIEPSLPGVYRWYGSRLLAFEPDADSLPQRRYTVTVSNDLRSLGGKSLQGERSFSFETERLSLIAWSLGNGTDGVDPKDAPPLEAKQINLLFSYPVNLGEIAQWLEVRTFDRSWPFTLSRPKEWKNQNASVDQAVVLTLKDTLPQNTSVELDLKKGARSEAGYLGTKETKVYPFHTLTPFRFKRVTTGSWSVPRNSQGDANPMYIEFSHPVDPHGVEKYISVEGLTVLRENVTVYGSTVVLNNLPVRYETSYRVHISAGLKDLWGRELAADASGSADIGAALSYAYVPNQGSAMLEAAFTPKIAWEIQNPLRISRALEAAAGPYERLPVSSTHPMDLSSIPKNIRKFEVDNLLPYLGPKGTGSVALRWEFVTKSDWTKSGTSTESAWLTVQVTDLGITTRYAYNRMLVWVTRLSTGEPVSDARVQLMEGSTVVVDGTTGADGLAVFNFTPGFFAGHFSAPNSYPAKSDGPFGKGLRIRVVNAGGPARGGDQAEFIPNESHNLWRFTVEATGDPFHAEESQAQIFLFTDRGIYRPGETVTFRGIDRNLRLGNYEPYEGPYAVEVSSGAYRAPVIRRVSGDTTATGGSYGSFSLPADLLPGNYVIKYQRGNSVQRTSFTVANFERLRFEAALAFADRPFLQGDTLSADFSASYLAGGALSGSPYTYFWTREPADFNPGGFWEYWRFGPELVDGRTYVDEGEGTLDPSGKTEIRMRTPKDGVIGSPYRYRLEVTARDAGRQEVARRTSVVVHPAAFYIAARLDGTAKEALSMETKVSIPSAFFLPQGKEATVRWALVTPDGERLVRGIEKPQELKLELIRYEWRAAKQAGVGGRVNLEWERVEEPVSSTFIDPSKGLYSFIPEKSGEWEIRLKSVDSQDRPVFTKLRFYVSGAGWIHWGAEDADAINLDTDKKSYLPGETAKILVRSPLPKGRYLLTVEREGILSQKVLELDGSAQTIEVPVEESYVPIVYVALSSYSVRSGKPTNTYFEPDLDKPKGVFGLTPLYIDPVGKRIDVDIEPLRPAYGPAEEAEVRLRAHSGNTPLKNVELSFMAVDRGVVDLIDYRVPDPLSFFYDPSRFPLAVRGADSRSLLIDPVTYALTDLQGGDATDDPKMKDRKDFRPTAVFEPYLVTGEDGTVTVRFKLPDSLTTYRCTAIAVDTARFGMAEKDLRVSAPLVAQAALPRKLRWRDTGNASILLTNLDSQNTEATVSLRITRSDTSVPTATAAEATASAPGTVDVSVLVVDDQESKTLSIPPGKTVEVPFRLAAVGTGKARLVFSLKSSTVNERIVKELTVDAPSVMEQVTTIGSLTEDRNFIEEGVMLPQGISQGSGSLSVSLSPGRLSMLKEAVAYLLDYPYGCLEQRTARLLPIVAFADHLDAFGLESAVTDPVGVINRELAFIGKSKLANGAFPYWPGGNRANYYVSLRIAHILALAEKKGYRIPDSFDTKALLSYIASSEDARRWTEGDPYLQGYALWVRSLYGERLGSELSRYVERGDVLGVAGWAFAGLSALELKMPELAHSAEDRIRSHIRPGSQTVDLTDTREGQARGEYWDSDSERYALALMLFQTLSPRDDMTTRLANALIERQRGGYWSNTNASYWAVIAFGFMADTEARGKTDFTARALLDGHTLLEGAFAASSSAPLYGRFMADDEPLKALKRNALLPLRIERSGTGSLYYTASLRYGIPSELAGGRDEGFGVYTETTDDKGAPVTDGIYIAGKTYIRRVVLSSPKARTYVAVRVPVPSGAEIVDATLATSAEERPLPPGAAGDSVTESSDKSWYTNEPLRFIMDDEIQFQWDYFPPGKRELVFRFRAVQPGVYPTPPAQGECMYQGEIFGRSAGELARIVTERP